ncbi:Outer membrane protein (Porin) [Paraburkholderia sabiae]|uniref:porin n=1 Tax=Paraburkholderia sabiae TaxID=273251 RepID=UPI001CAACB3C|nr:porin [Paraburkholderia sabiae]CAG9191347.1 Outer membrane protein (Porin) [Paraburkholderia sabiae]
MKKLAIFASAVASACALGTAHAQSSVTLYGVIDNGIEYQDGGAGSVVRASSGGLAATVYGMKGEEDIGGGLHVNFQLEQGFSAVNGQASNPADAFNRLAWIGLSGDFGELRFGRQKKPEYLYLNREMDAVGVQSIASPLNNFNDVTVRASNAITYFTPEAYGLTAQFSVAMRDDTTKPTNGIQFYNAVARWVSGHFRVAAGYEQQGNASGTALQRVLRAVASYGTKSARVYLAYQSERESDNSEKLDIYSLSGSYSFSPFDRLSLMYGYAHDRTGQGNNAQQVGLTYAYFLSKSTTLYTSAGFIQNRNQAQFTLNGTEYSGIDVTPGANVKGVIVGMVHRF